MTMGSSMELRDVLSICTSMDFLLAPGFGPNALNTLLSTATGQILVSSDGMQVLEGLSTDHPVGRLIMDSARALKETTGEGTKSLILLLQGMIQAVVADQGLRGRREKFGVDAQDTGLRAGLLKGFSVVKNHVFPELITEVLSCSRRICLSCGDENAVKDQVDAVLLGSMQGKFPRCTTRYLCDLVMAFLLEGLVDTSVLPELLRDCIDNFEFICVDAVGHSPVASRVMDGYIMEREMLSQCPPGTDKPVTFALLDCSLEGDEYAEDSPPNQTPIYTLTNAQGISSALRWKEKHLSLFLSSMKARDIHLILTSRKESELAINSCRAASIGLVHAVTEEELRRLAYLFNVNIIYSKNDVDETSAFGRIRTCEAIAIGGRSCVRLVPMETYNIARHSRESNQSTKASRDARVSTGECSIASRLRPRGEKEYRIRVLKQFIIAAPSKGMAHQAKYAILNGLKCLVMWLDNDQFSHQLPSKPGEVRATSAAIFPPRVPQVPSPGVTAATCGCRSGSGHTVGMAIPIGGAYELRLHALLERYCQTETDVNVKVACRALQKAMMMLPLRLVNNSFDPDVKALLLATKNDNQPGDQWLRVDGRSGKVLRGSQTSGVGREPIASKVYITHYALELIKQILRLDRTIPVSGRLASQH